MWIAVCPIIIIIIIIIIIVVVVVVVVAWNDCGVSQRLAL